MIESKISAQSISKIEVWSQNEEKTIKPKQNYNNDLFSHVTQELQKL